MCRRRCLAVGLASQVMLTGAFGGQVSRHIPLQLLQQHWQSRKRPAPGAKIWKPPLQNVHAEDFDLFAGAELAHNTLVLDIQFRKALLDRLAIPCSEFELALLQDRRH